MRLFRRTKRQRRLSCEAIEKICSTVAYGGTAASVHEALMCMITTAARCDEDVRGSSGALRGCSRETAEKRTNGCRGTADKDTGKVADSPRRRSAAVAPSPIEECSNGAVVGEERRRGRAAGPALSGASPSKLDLKQRIQVIVRIRPIEETAARCGSRLRE